MVHPFAAVPRYTIPTYYAEGPHARWSRKGKKLRGSIGQLAGLSWQGGKGDPGEEPRQIAAASGPTSNIAWISAGLLRFVSTMSFAEKSAAPAQSSA